MKKENDNSTKDGLVTTIINKVSSIVLKMNDSEIKKLGKIMVNQPNLTKASMALASDMKCSVNWDIIITSLRILTMESINYSKIASGIKQKNPNLTDDYIIKEVDGLYKYIVSIDIEHNRSELIKMESPVDSKYRLSTLLFRKFMFGEKTVDDFHNDIISLMISIINEDLSKPKYKNLVS